MKMRNAAPRGEKTKTETDQKPWEAREDMLTACARVFLFSLSTTRGDRRPYRGHWRCSGEEEKRHG